MMNSDNPLSDEETAFVARVFVNEDSVLEKSSGKIREFFLRYPLSELLDNADDAENAAFFASSPFDYLCRDVHNADRHAMRIQQIQELIDIDASCLLKQDEDCQDLPIHSFLDEIANYFYRQEELAADPTSLDLLRKMIHAQPSILSIPNSDGDTALHVACIAGSDLSVELVCLLFQGNPTAATIRNRRGDTPLEVALEFGVPPEVVQFWIQECPSILFMQDDYGYTTLHTACARHEASPTTENIKILVEASPILLTYKTSSGQTPLHVACESAVGFWNHDDFFSIIEFLIESNREVIAWKDNDGKLPLHYIFSGRFSLQEKLALIRLHMPILPQLMTVKDSDGKTPDQYGYLREQKFATQATPLLEEEYFTKEMIKWTNQVAEASCKTIPAVSIVMDWTKTKCLENLAFIESELNDLVAATKSENSV